MKKIIFLIIGLFSITSSIHLKAQCISQDDLDALIALYNSTGGDSWTNNSGWDVNASPCDVTNDWYGITIEGGEVTYLYLQNNNLTGSIPPEIGNLTGLIRLYLYGNNLSGSIPPEIGLLSNLDYFTNRE
jgi:Leucine-rich repeat (LRR) protein